MKSKDQMEENGKRLNIKKVKLMTADTATSLRLTMKIFKKWINFCILGMTINNKRTSIQEIRYTLVFGKVAMKAWGKNI